MREGALSEEMRVLYVALTRAKEHLVLSGSVSLAKRAARWAEACANGAPLEIQDLLSAQSMLDWVGPALAATPDGRVLTGITEESLTGTDPITHRGRYFQVVLHPNGEIANLEIPGGGAHRDNAVFEAVAAGRPLRDRGMDGSVRETLERLAWTYPFRAVSDLPARRIASELPREHPDSLQDATQFAFQDRLASTPPWRAAAKGEGAERGTAVHRFLERLDFSAPVDEASLEAAIGRMVDGGDLEESQARFVDPAKIAAFLGSPLGVRLRASVDRIRREVPFTLLSAAGAYGANVPAEAREEPVLYRGIIDLLLVEDDGCLILDYKTDRLRPGEEPQRAEHYRAQMDVYRDAIEAAFGMSVKERVLFFLDTGQAVGLS